MAIPEYDDELYEAQLRSDEWSREETDYLFQLAKDFDLRWILIADRYDYQPKESQESGDDMALTAAPKVRSMEDMKARYYQVASKVIVIKQPPASMSEQEFEAYERMTKFDPTRETTRKKLAEALLARSPEEVKEEETLLSELKRIVTNEERFLQERKELYNRLDHPVAPQGSVAAYESSGALNQLVQTLLHADKAKKRRSLTGPDDNASSPAQGTPSQHTPNLSRDHRGSVSGQSTTKKASGAGGKAPRQLSPRDETKFGVSTHERLSSGVSFRSSRIDKLILAKSASQSQKLQAVITQLGLPLRAVMPSTRVCDEYEQLVQNIHKLLDVRKHSEKTANEMKVLDAQKEARLKRERGEEEDTSMMNAEDVENRDPEEAKEDSDMDADADAEGEVDVDAEADADEDADGEEDGEADTTAHQATSDNDPAEDEDNEDAEVDNEEDPDADADEVDNEDVDEADQSDAEADPAVEDQEEEDEEESGDEVHDSDDEDEVGEDVEPNEQNDSENETRASVAPSIKSTRSTGRHKRSASAMSTPSEKSTKRQKK